MARLTVLARRGSLYSMKLLGLAGLSCLSLVAACSSESVSSKPVLGNYSVMISQDGKSDPDVLSILNGSDGALLLTFIAGITTDADGPNASGLRASLGDGYTLTLAKQPAHIDHSTGLLNGTLWGDGQVTGMNIHLTFHYLPTNFAINQMLDPDGGVVLTRPDMAPATSLDYDITGSRLL
jgi:hypothetical protein